LLILYEPRTRLLHVAGLVTGLALAYFRHCRQRFPGSGQRLGGQFQGENLGGNVHQRFSRRPWTRSWGYPDYYRNSDVGEQTFGYGGNASDASPTSTVYASASPESFRSDSYVSRDGFDASQSPFSSNGSETSSSGRVRGSLDSEYDPTNGGGGWFWHSPSPSGDDYGASPEELEIRDSELRHRRSGSPSPSAPPEGHFEAAAASWTPPEPNYPPADGAPPPPPPPLAMNALRRRRLQRFGYD